MKPILIYDSPITSLTEDGDYAREVADYICNLDSKYDIFFIDTPMTGSQCSFVFENENITKILKRKLHTSRVEYVDLYLKMGNPSDFKTIGKKNIGIITQSTTLFTKTEVELCSKMDKIIVPSKYASDYLSDKTETDIQVIERCVHTHKPTSYDKSDELVKYIDSIEEEYCFLFDGNWNLKVSPSNEVNNINALIRSFIHSTQNIKNKPALLLRTNYLNYSRTDYDKIQSHVTEILKDSHIENPNIYVLHGHFTSHEVRELYRHPKIKTTISMSRGKFFERSIFESLINNKPVVVSENSSANEFLTSDKFKVSGKTEKTESDNSVGEYSKFEVDIEQFSEKLKDIHDNYESYRVEVESIVNSIKTTHNKKTIGDKYKEVINSYI